jgi:hypothetical protein
MSIKWCFTRARSSTVGFAVPISKTSYTWRESAETTSPVNRFASSSDNSVLPTAVGPTSSNALFSFESFVEFIDGYRYHHRSSMRTKIGIFCGKKLIDQRNHRFRRQPVSTHDRGGGS